MDINSILANEVNKNAVVNTFTKGMNTDTSDSMMPSDQYRVALNLRLITHDNGDNGELSLIEGYDKVYNSFVNVAAATLVRQYGIVVDRQTEVEVEVSLPGGGSAISIEPADYWNIFRITYDDSNSLYTVDKIFGPCLDPLGDAVSLVTRYEYDDNVKLYIADGKHPLMMINIADPANASLPSTDISMISSYTENTFATPWAYSTMNGTPVVGSLKPATIQYAYILYDKYGKSSNLSPLSELKVIDRKKRKGSNQHTVGLYKEEIGESGFCVQIYVLAGVYKKIKLFRITYVEVGQDPTIDMIDDSDLSTTSTYEFYDTGGSLATMSYAEFLALQKIPIVPTEIESKNDYLFASNVKYQIDLNQQLVSQFAAFDPSCLITDDGYTNMNTPFFTNYPDNRNWMQKTGTYVDWELKETDYSGAKSLRRDEIYRYGLVLYDKYENPWPVKWLCDLRTPPITDGKKYSTEKRISNGVLEFANLTVDFTIHWDAIESYFTADPDFFTAFEIVRCKRTENDRYTITQGIIGRPFECYKYAQPAGEGYEINSSGATVGNSTGLLCPTGYMTTDRIVAFPENHGNSTDVYGVGSSNYVLFASPEICYQHDDLLNLATKYPTLLKLVWQDNEVLEAEELTREAIISTGINTITLEPVDTYYHKLTDNSIPGMAFCLTRYYWDGSNIQEDSYDGMQNVQLYYALYVNTRLFYPCHEPVEYHNNPSKDVTDVSYDGGYYYRSPNGVKMRKTIFDLFILGTRSGFSGFTADSNDGEDTYYLGFLNQTSCSVSGIFDIKIPKYDEFADGTNGIFSNNASYADGKQFIPWSVPTMATWNDVSEFEGEHPSSNGGTDWIPGNDTFRGYYPVSSVGKSLLLKLQSSWFDDETAGHLHYLTASICNLRRTNIVPYGGFTANARKNSVYYSFGNYREKTSGNQSISVQDGDCFIQQFRYNAAKTYYSPEVRYGPNMSTIYVFPVETDIDIDHELGWSSKYQSAEPNSYIQDDAAVLRGYTQSEPCYVANTAYNINETARYFTGQDKDDLENVNYDYRVCYSNLKLNNESFDSWLSFKSANYIDVDTRYGLITDLRLFKDTLLFWLDNAVGVLSVNERTIIQDANDTNIILGNGDVLQRYDYLTTEYGMKPNQYVDCQSNTTLYWWDGYRKEILSYSGGQSVTPMNKLKTIDNYINSRDEFTYPSIAYDVKYNEVLFSVVGYYTLAYSEVVQQFISNYDVQFKHRFNFYDKLMLLDDTKMYEWNKSPQNSTLTPYLKFVVNPQTLYNNIYDNMQLAGRFYGGNYLGYINMTFKTPLKLESRIINGVVDTNTDNYIGITNREYDFRFAVPRAGHYVTENNTQVWKQAEWGDRMRGKVMECELSTTSSDPDFSLQYIITKYRKSWI